MNLTRIYPGGMFEPPDKYAPGNPLGPLPGRHLLPWARTTTPGAHPSLAAPGQPSMKFDLDSWNPDYFVRLKAFVLYAARKGIVVEVAFFNGMYADGWPLMPLYHANNIQGVGTYEAAECGLFTTDDPRNQDVIRYQKAYVAKVATELNGFDNVIFDISDEPLLQGNPDGGITIMKEAPVVPWLHAMRDAFQAAIAKLPRKPVLGQTVQSLSPDLSLEPWCQWLPTEYVKAARNALEKNYGARKPIVDVESDYFGVGLVKPYVADDVRLEGWWFLLGGGAGIINLNSEYHRGQPAGGPDTRERILPQRRILKTFMETLDLETIARFEGVKTRSGWRRGQRACHAGTPVRRLHVPRRRRQRVGRALRRRARPVSRPDHARRRAGRALSPGMGGPDYGARREIRHGQRERRRSRRQHSLLHARHRAADDAGALTRTAGFGL